MAEKPRVAVLISGRGSNLGALLRAAAAPDYPAKIALVISNVADAGGLMLAKTAGVPTRVMAHKDFGKDREAHERAIDAVLREENIDLVCLAGYMRLLTPFLVRAWPGRILNIHPALLPAFKGLDTHRRALEAGVSEHGCTVHLVTEGMDEGPILGQEKVPVLPGDTEEILAARVLAAEHLLYPAMLAQRARDFGAARM
jgi:formyltetrahydrofolate-dependent phosphoribosylglycinamide formyltransferase